MQGKEPEDFKQVVRYTWYTGGAFFIGTILGQTNQLDLFLGVFSILVVLMLQRHRGVWSWLLAFILFSACTLSGILFFYGFLSSLTSPSFVNSQATLPVIIGAIVVYLPPLLALTLGCCNLFLIVTSRSLNRYLVGEDAIFPVDRKRAGESRTTRPPSGRAEAVVNAALSAAMSTVSETNPMSVPVVFCALEGIRFISDVQERGLETALRREATRTSGRYVSASISDGLWRVVSLKMDPRFVNSPSGRLTKVAFEETIDQVMSRGARALVTEES